MDDSVQAPSIRNALQVALARVLGPEIRSDDQVLDGIRDQNLAPSSQCADSSADVYGDAANLRVDCFDLARVQTRPYLQPKRLDRLGDGYRASHAPSRAVEHGEEAVARGVDLRAAIAAQHGPDHGVMTLDDVLPRPVSELGALGRRSNDIGEHDGREHAVEDCLLIADPLPEPSDL